MSKPAGQDRFEQLWDRLLDVPEGHVGEIVGGEIRSLPRPDPPHLHAASRMGTLIDGPFGLGTGGPGGWVILDEPRIRFEDALRVPDLAGWRRQRYVVPQAGPYVVMPDWICEVLSPSTAAGDRAEKQPLYARCGVGHLWFADPLTRTLEVMRRQDQLWLVVAVHRGEEVVRAEPFEEIELDLSLLWMPADG